MATMFPDAKGIAITGGRFTNVEGGDVNHVQYTFNMAGNADDSHARAMEILCQNIASGAFHDSAERFDPPKCHPDTRQAIVKKIMDWIEDPDNLQYFLWMYGPAGCGKSAIAQTIAEMCAEAGLLAASFFFSRTVPGRNDKAHFIPSLVYQLCVTIPEMRVHVATAVELDPFLFSRSVASQTQALLVKPLNLSAVHQKPQEYPNFRPRVIVVDGLDECSDSSSHSEILSALSAAVKHSSVPLLFLVASRAEHEIREAFNSSWMRSLTTGLPLDDTYQPDDDIRVFLEAKFAEIKEKHPSRGYLPTDWPSVDDIDRLVEKSSGQFIYASTVMLYVGSRHGLPLRRLKVVLGLSSAENDADRPFAQLDALYHHILASVHESNLPNALEILSLSILHVYGWPLALADELFAHEPGSAQIIMNDLHALLHIPEADSTDQQLRMLHASFPDFLLDQSRSGRFFIDAAKARTNLARRWLTFYGKHIPDLHKAGIHPMIPTDHVHHTCSTCITETIFQHCTGGAYLSAELQADLYNFEVEKSFSVAGSHKSDMWYRLGAAVNFIAWLEHQIPTRMYIVISCYECRNVFKNTFQNTQRTSSLICRPL
ncbi:hypothetical protein BDZ97DRAFT_260710 [Flammula alnicola]|nr:hypothetical protein BDZ97DRAFT_260710 [Flammula alnicola]